MAKVQVAGWRWCDAAAVGGGHPTIVITLYAARPLFETCGLFCARTQGYRPRKLARLSGGFQKPARIKPGAQARIGNMKPDARSET